VSPIIVALDFDDLATARALVAQLDPALCRLKVGKAMFTRFGPAWVLELTRLGFEIFLDLKFHDIPNQVAGAVKAAADLGVWMVNVHASGGHAMMTAARDALQSFGSDAPLLIAVTVLTSLSNTDLKAIGFQADAEYSVLSLAQLAHTAKLDGVVCSPREIRLLRLNLPPEFLLVTPGIRDTNAPPDDQVRTYSAPEALAAGANYLVVGRPITGAKDPRAALEAVVAV